MIFSADLESNKAILPSKKLQGPTDAWYRIESSSTDVLLLFTDGKDPIGDCLYPAVSSGALVLSKGALQTLGRRVNGNEQSVHR